MYTKLKSYEDHFDFKKTNQFSHTPPKNIQVNVDISVSNLFSLNKSVEILQ